MNARTCCTALACLTLLGFARLSAQEEVSSEHNQLRSRPLYQQLQQTLEAVSRAEIAREEAALIGKAESDLESIRQQCRVALEQLGSLELQLDELLSQAYRKKPSQRDKTSWTVPELESLRRNLTVQRARAYRTQAMCYAANSPDRVNSLSQALARVDDIASQPLSEASVWQARVEQVLCLRLLGKLPEARHLLAQWHAASPSELIVSRFAGEQIRLELASNSNDRALALVENIHKSKQVVAPETDDAILEALLAASQRSKLEQRRELIRRATEQLRHITQMHGLYWKKRAETRIGQALAEDSGIQDPLLLNYAASHLYAVGKLNRAVATYDRIAALSDSDADQRFEASKTAAAIVHQQEQPGNSMRRFRQLAKQHLGHKEATSSHLIAIGLAAELVRTANLEARGEIFEQYLMLLTEHLELWPESPWANTVETWLKRSELPNVERQRAHTLAKLGNRQKALKLYQSLIRETPSDGELLESYATLLAEGSDRIDLREALATWQMIEKRSKPGGPRWWRGRRARLVLLERLGEGEQAKKLQQLTEILYESRTSSRE